VRNRTHSSIQIVRIGTPPFLLGSSVAIINRRKEPRGRNRTIDPSPVVGRPSHFLRRNLFQLPGIMWPGGAPASIGPVSVNRGDWSSIFKFSDWRGGHSRPLFYA
jgi:hypothetical protein